MEQAGRSGESDRNQQRRMKMPENIAAVVTTPPQPPPQKCPRCDSNNTKFCYYNNYSLTQPRYFCKTCRRYWTQGGTLRNVPVGGGCRKGKRTIKGGPSSSSSAGESSSRSSQSHPPPPPLNMGTNLSAPFFLGNNSRSQTLPLMSTFYPSGGFLSSLAAMQSMTQSQGVNQSLGVSSNQFGGTSNMTLLQGLQNLPTPPKADHQNQQIEPQSGLYQVINREKSMESSFYPSDQTLFQPTRPLGSWTQRFINTSSNNNNNNDVWNSSASASGATTNTVTTAGSSLAPNQWPDLPGFGPSP